MDNVTTKKRKLSSDCYLTTKNDDDELQQETAPTSATTSEAAVASTATPTAPITETLITRYEKQIAVTLESMDTIISNFFSSSSCFSYHGRTASNQDDNIGGIRKKESESDEMEKIKQTTAMEMIGVDSQYNELYKALRSSLLPSSSSFSLEQATTDSFEQDIRYITRNNNPVQNNNKNVAVLLVGPRGCGKQTLLNHVLNKLSREAEETTTQMKKSTMQCNAINADNNTSFKKRKFRVVYLNGLLLRSDNGDTDALAVREIIRQLSQIAHDDAFIAQKQNTQNSNKGSFAKEEDHVSHNEQQQQELHEESRHTNKSTMPQQTQTNIGPNLLSFQSNIEALDDVFQRAQVDGIPILIVLYELDIFAKINSSYQNNNNSVGHQNNYENQTSTTTTNTNPSSTIQSSKQNKKQLLLYHLLDRVSSHKSNVSVVGITTKLSTLESLERRVKSRVQGSQYFIYLGYFTEFRTLLSVLKSKFLVAVRGAKKQEEKDCTSTIANTMRNDDHDTRTNENSSSEKDMIDWKQTVIHTIASQFASILDEEKSPGEEEERASEETYECDNKGNSIRDLFYKNWNLGKDIRWFSHICFVALSLCMTDYISNVSSSSNQAGGEKNSTKLSKELLPKLSCHHFRQAFFTMGESGNYQISRLHDLKESNEENRHNDEEDGKGKDMDDSKTNNNSNNEISVNNRDTNNITTRNNNGTGDIPDMVATISQTALHNISFGDGRIQALLDSSEPQIAILLSMKRILHRYSQQRMNSTSGESSRHSLQPPPPKKITLQCILDEYQNKFIYQRLTIRKFSRDILVHSFIHLLESDLIQVISPPHSYGSSTKQNNPTMLPMIFSPSSQKMQNNNVSALHLCTSEGIEKASLICTLDMAREIHVLLKAGMLDCSTALREWGLKMNK